MDWLAGSVGVLVVLGIALIVLLIGREIVCWYWKINAALDQFERLEAVLRNIDRNVLVIAQAAAGEEDAEDEGAPRAPPQ